jgi:hypothetical protein
LKRLGVYPTLTPIAHHHRCRRTAAQQLGLRNERDVEQRERLRPAGRRKKGEREREQRGGWPQVDSSRAQLA